MAVSIARSGRSAVVTVTVDAADLIDQVTAGTLTTGQAKLIAAQRAARHLADAVDAAGRTDAELDQRAASAAAEATRLKALRPTGDL